jgi:hypothetical protein
VCLLSICQVVDKNGVVVEWRVADCVTGTSLMDQVSG